MALLFAHLEHQIRRTANTVGRAITQRWYGFDNYEQGDYLAADALANREAEEEVAEPSVDLNGLIAEINRVTRSDGAWLAGPPRCPNAGQMCNCTGACLRSPTVPAGLIESEARSPAGLPTPGEFAAVAVREVLAEHPHYPRAGDGWCCGGCSEDRMYADEYRAHVAAEVARRIDAATKSQAQQPK
jgi:hypothetical protein